MAKQLCLFLILRQIHPSFSFMRCREGLWVMPSRCIQFHLSKTDTAGFRRSAGDSPLTQRNAPAPLNLSDSFSESPLGWTWVGTSIRCRLCPGESFTWAEPNSKRPVARLLFYPVSPWWAVFASVYLVLSVDVQCTALTLSC